MRFWVIVVELALLAVLVRRAAMKYTKMGLIWACVVLAGFATAGFSGAKSTTPSSAPRSTVSGVAQDCVQRQFGRSNYTYSFLLLPSDAPPVRMATRIKLPLCWNGTQSGTDNRLYRVVYLDDPNRTLKNEAISIDVLEGNNAGWHDAVDARVFGLWIGVPLGILLIVIGGIGAARNRKTEPDVPGKVKTRSGPLQDTESELTDLNL